MSYPSLHSVDPQTSNNIADSEIIIQSAEQATLEYPNLPQTEFTIDIAAQFAQIFYETIDFSLIQTVQSYFHCIRIIFTAIFQSLTIAHMHQTQYDYFFHQIWTDAVYPVKKGEFNERARVIMGAFSKFCATYADEARNVRNSPP